MLLFAYLCRAIDRLYRRLWGVPLLRFSRLADNLHLDGQYSRAGIAILRKRGITAIVSMRPRLYHQDSLTGFNMLHLPTVDKTPPSLEDLKRGVKFITQEMESGGKVYVHCRVGEGRAPTMTAAYLISTGMSVADALATIKKTRPFIAPNQAQLDQLHAFHASLSHPLK